MARVQHGSCMDDARGGVCFSRVGVRCARDRTSYRSLAKNQDQRRKLSSDTAAIFSEANGIEKVRLLVAALRTRDGARSHGRVW